MSVTTTATLTTGLSWSQRDPTDGRTVYTDTSQLSQKFAFPDISTSGIGSINGEWNASIQLPPSGQVVLDLFALPRQLFNETMYVAFTGTGNTPSVLAIYIQNTATASGADASIMATGTHAFTGPFNGGTGNIPIPASAPYIASRPYGGWVVNSSQRFLQLQDAGSGVTLQMGIVGITG